MKYKTFIFDFNGTILDDVSLCFNILNFMLSKRGYKKITLERYKDIFQFPIIEYYKKAGFDLEKHSFSELAEEFIEAYQKESLKLKLYDGIIELLDYLKMNNVTTICLSASELTNLKEQLSSFNILDKFDYVIGIDNINAKGKLDIAINFFSSHNNLANDMVFLGDTTHDFIVANSLKSDVILVTYGHESDVKLKRLNAITISEIKEIYKYL